jgi:hypothetical protein
MFCEEKIKSDPDLFCVLCESCQKAIQKADLDGDISAVKAVQENAMLSTIAESADKLEDWMFANAGTNSDWPLQCKLGDSQSTKEFRDKLQDLRNALKPYRKLSSIGDCER